VSVIAEVGAECIDIGVLCMSRWVQRPSASLFT
jgi:hypothetical protein